jgi:hypothetical protein
MVVNLREENYQSQNYPTLSAENPNYNHAITFLIKGTWQ